MIDPPYRTVAVASTFSPRFVQVLAEGKRIRDRLASELHLIYVGKRDEETTRKFSSALRQLDLPVDSTIYYHEGDPAGAILEAVTANGSTSSWPARWKRKRCFVNFLAMSRAVSCAKPRAR